MESGFDSNGTFYLINKKKDVPIVFIHGVGLNHSIWDNQIREFENTVLVYDILGHGKTPLNLNTISFDDFTNQLIYLLNHLEIDKIHLVGFSIGSLIARNFATKYCEKLKSLTLFGSIFNRSNEQQKLVNDRFENMKKEKKIPHSSLTRWLSDDFLEKHISEKNKIIKILDENDVENFLKVYELFVTHKDEEVFEKINIKTLVITGENDTGSTPEMSNNLSKAINNSYVKIIPKGKHLCGIEHSHDVNDAIKELIND